MDTRSIKLQVKLSVIPEQMRAFTTLAGDLAEEVQNQEKETLSYEWYLDEADTTCYVVEHYRSSEALVQHLNHVGAALGPLLDIAPLTEMLVFGQPSDEARAVLSSLGARFCPQMTGFSRLG